MTTERLPAEHTGRGSFRPICTAQWDILEPFPVVRPHAVDERAGPVHLLVRLGTEPLGYVDFEFEDADSLSSIAALSVSRSLRSEVNARLVKSGLPPITEVPSGGLRLDPNQLAFVVERKHLLENAPDVSVVICTRDRPAHIAHCVHRLARQEYPRFEIVVVDNAPADPGVVPALLESLDLCMPVRYMLEARGGLSWARNAGWRAAKADIIAFLDDDAVPDRHWLAEIVRGFSAGSKVGCVTGKVLPAELRTEHQQVFEQLGGTLPGRGFDREVFGPGHSQSPLYPYPPFGAGANMAFQREVLVDIGGFHVALGAGTPAMAAEDTFAFTRVLLAQHTVVYQPTALVFHHHRDTRAGLKKQLHGYEIATGAFYAALMSSGPKIMFSVLRLLPTVIKQNWREGQIRSLLAGVRAYALSREIQSRVVRANSS